MLNNKFILVTLIAQGGALMAAAQTPSQMQAQLTARATRALGTRGMSWHVAAYNGSAPASVIRHLCCTPDPIAYLTAKYRTDKSSLTDYDRELARQLAEQVLATEIQNNLQAISRYQPSIWSRTTNAVGGALSSTWQAVGGADGIISTAQTAVEITSRAPEIAGTLHAAGTTIADNISYTASTLLGRSKSYSPTSGLKQRTTGTNGDSKTN